MCVGVIANLHYFLARLAQVIFLMNKKKINYIPHQMISLSNLKLLNLMNKKQNS